MSANQRVGLFGGTFNPLHLGHINAINAVHSRLSLDQIMVVPAARNPRKPPIEGPSDEQRLEMLRVGLGEFSEYVKIDDQELKRGGLSYTLVTLETYAKTVAPENLYLIIGMDQFEEFDSWKDFEHILKIANLAVVARPGHNPPFALDDLPKGLQPLVGVFDRQFIALSSGRHIEFVRLRESDISASDVRKRLRSGRSVDRHLTIAVEDYIRKNNLYGPLSERIGDYEAFTRFCGNVLFEKKAIQVRGFDLTGRDAPTDFTLIASGTSTRHASSLAEAVARAVKDEFNVFPQSIEGSGEGRWVLLDYGALIVHVFYDFVRQEYHIEDLWKAGRDLALKDPVSQPTNK